MDAGKTGAYLAALRKARGMTQQEAADQLGVSNKTVSKWETARGCRISPCCLPWRSCTASPPMTS